MRVMVNIFLVGFMGAGKTSVGRLLAGRLGARFLDLDHELVEVFGCSIADVFRTRGEAVFRAAEAEMLERLCGVQGLVVATGGGAFQSRSNRRVIEASGGISVFLDVPWEALRGRLERDNSGRPVYRDADQARALFEARLPSYRRATVTIPLTGEEAPEVVAATVSDVVRGAPCGS